MNPAIRLFMSSFIFLFFIPVLFYILKTPIIPFAAICFTSFLMDVLITLGKPPKQNSVKKDLAKVTNLRPVTFKE